jgi:DNA-binding MarR family transcriptional regulator
MSEDTTSLAQRLLQVLLPLGKTVTNELRHTGQLMAPAHFRTMGSLYLRSANLSDLAESQGVSLPTMSNTVTSLEQKGWVKRQRSELDRRVVMVELTPAGCDKLGELTDTVLTMLDALLKNITPAERESLLDGICVLENMFDTISLPEDPNIF